MKCKDIIGGIGRILFFGVVVPWMMLIVGSHSVAWVDIGLVAFGYLDGSTAGFPSALAILSYHFLYLFYGYVLSCRSDHDSAIGNLQRVVLTTTTLMALVAGFLLIAANDMKLNKDGLRYLSSLGLGVVFLYSGFFAGKTAQRSTRDKR